MSQQTEMDNGEGRLRNNNVRWLALCHPGNKQQLAKTLKHQLITEVQAIQAWHTALLITATHWIPGDVYSL